MITIRLLDARRGLHSKCVELFGNAKIAEAIYRFLCDGIEECEDAEPERKKGEWIKAKKSLWSVGTCSVCGAISVEADTANYCKNCGADMRGEDDGLD